MSTLTVRNIDDDLKQKLRERAARHGHSMEEEIRTILREQLAKPIDQRGLGTLIHQRFAPLGGVDLDPPQRDELPRVVDLT